MNLYCLIFRHIFDCNVLRETNVLEMVSELTGWEQQKLLGFGEFNSFERKGKGTLIEVKQELKCARGTRFDRTGTTLNASESESMRRTWSYDRPFLSCNVQIPLLHILFRRPDFQIMTLPLCVHLKRTAGILSLSLFFSSSSSKYFVLLWLGCGSVRFVSLEKLSDSQPDTNTLYRGWLTVTQSIQWTRVKLVHECVSIYMTVCIHINLLCALRSCCAAASWHTAHTAFISGPLKWWALLWERVTCLPFILNFCFNAHKLSFWNHVHISRAERKSKWTRQMRAKECVERLLRTELLQPPLWQKMWMWLISASIACIDIATLHILHLRKNSHIK